MTNILTIWLAIFALCNTAHSAPQEGKNTITGGKFGSTDQVHLDRTWTSGDGNTKAGLYGELVQNPSGLEGALGAHVTKNWDLDTGNVQAGAHAEYRKNDFGGTTNSFGGDLSRTWKLEDHRGKDVGSWQAKTYGGQTSSQFGGFDSKTNTFGGEVARTWQLGKSDWRAGLFAEHQQPSWGPSSNVGGFRITGHW